MASKTVGGTSTSYTYDKAGQLSTAVTGGNTTNYSFDANGNRTAQGATTLSYNQANRMTAYGSTGTYVYNGDGLRTSKTVSGSSEAYVWDISASLPTIVKDGTTSYITGLGGLPLEAITSSGAAYYYHLDQIGSVRAVTDSNGTTPPADSYQYDAYGNTLSSTVGFAQPFGFAGQYKDSESGLYYLRARYYDPSTGQFISRDPLTATTRQPYSYVLDNPLNGTDPTGLDFWGSLQSEIISFGRWANTPTEAPNFAEAYDAQFNVGYGAYKVATGVPVLLAGATAEVTIPVLGQTGGTLALLYGGYQTVTGTARIIRGCRQAFDLEQHPLVTESPIQQAQGLLTGVIPGGQRAEDFLGGLF